MKTWRQVWRDSLVGNFSEAALSKLRDALAGDDPALIQGFTTFPSSQWGTGDRPPEKCCPLGLALMETEGLSSIATVMDAFNDLCYDTPDIGSFLVWVDGSPR